MNENLTPKEVALQPEKLELQKKFGSIRTIIVPLDEDDDSKQAVLFLRKPDKMTRDMVSSLVSKNKSEAAIVACLKALYIGGDALDLVLNNEDAMISIEGAIVELLMVQKSIIKKN